MPRARAFSLIELLVVVAIMATMMVLGAAAFSKIARNSNLTSGSNRLIDQLNLARQTAMVMNCPVEFRLYQLPPEGSAATAQPSVYRAFQSFTVPSDGTSTNAVGKPVFLPQSVYMSANGTVSSLLTVKNPPTSFAGTAAAVPVGPYAPSSYNYISFHFKPDGSTDLASIPATPWYVSLAVANDPTQSGSSLPANFVTVQLDPLTGRVRYFRPN